MLPTLKQSGQLCSFYTWHCSAQGLPFRVLPLRNVSSYLTFSSLPYGGYFLWHFLFSMKALFNTRWAALCCPDFPFRLKIETIARICSGVKLQRNFWVTGIGIYGITVASQHLYCNKEMNYASENYCWQILIIINKKATHVV